MSGADDLHDEFADAIQPLLSTEQDALDAADVLIHRLKSVATDPVRRLAILNLIGDVTEAIVNTDGTYISFGEAEPLSGSVLVVRPREEATDAE